MCLQTTKLKNPSEQSVDIAKHTVEYLFTDDGDIRIRQTVGWLGSFTLSSCYLAMLPASKDVSDSYVTDKSLEITELNQTDYEIYIPNAKYCRLFGDDIQFVFEIPVYPSNYSDGNRLLLTDNNGGDYNKVYYVVTRDGATVSNGDLWQSETHYKIY